ncbi:MAG: ABC transporter permease subunit [Nanohaloarchaea archaeon]|nr:ABC transporter permease subunit [Candidatus Nanohaloarchaea archaeon]
MLNKGYIIKIIINCSGLFFLFLFWELFVENFLIPKPSEIIITFFKLLSFEETWKNILISGIRVYTSITIALILGTIIGSLRYFKKEIYFLINPLFYPTQYIASAVWTIIGIVLFGLSPITPYFVIIIVILPNIFVSVQIGLNNINKTFIEYGKSHTQNKWRLYKYIIFPQILPHLLIGLIRSNAVAWKIVVTAELFISINGLGFMINNYYKMLDIQKLFATVLIIILIGLIFDQIFKHLKIKIEERYII